MNLNLDCVQNSLNFWLKSCHWNEWLLDALNKKKKTPSPTVYLYIAGYSLILVKKERFMMMSMGLFLFLHLHEIVEGLYFHFSLSVCLCVCLSVCLSVCPMFSYEQNSSRTDVPIWTQFSLNGCLLQSLKPYWNRWPWVKGQGHSDVIPIFSSYFFVNFPTMYLSSLMLDQYEIRYVP